MNKNDYAKIGKLVAGGALVAAGLWRRSLFGMLLMGAGGVVLKRTLRPKGPVESATEKKVAKEAPPPEIRVVHEADLESMSEADTTS